MKSKGWKICLCFRKKKASHNSSDVAKPQDELHIQKSSKSLDENQGADHSMVHTPGADLTGVYSLTDESQSVLIDEGYEDGIVGDDDNIGDMSAISLDRPEEHTKKSTSSTHGSARKRAWENEVHPFLGDLV